MLKSSYTPAEIRHLLAQEESRNKRFYNAHLAKYCNKISRVMAKNKWKGIKVFFKGRTSRKFPTTPHSISLGVYASCIYDLCRMLEERGFSVEVTTENGGRDCLNVSV